MDLEKIKQGVKLILEGIGEDLSREGLIETPERKYSFFFFLRASFAAFYRSCFCSVYS